VSLDYSVVVKQVPEKGTILRVYLVAIGDEPDPLAGGCEEVVTADKCDVLSARGEDVPDATHACSLSEK